MSHTPIISPLALRVRSLQTVPKPSLADKLLGSIAQSNFYEPARKYFPSGSIKRLIIQEEIEKELNKVEEDPDKGFVEFYNCSIRRDLARWISANAQITFAICAQLELGAKELVESMVFFNARVFDDRCLPLKDPQGSRPDKEIFPPEIWTPSKLGDFYDKQWMYLVPVFSPSQYNYDLHYNCILPFTKEETGPKTGAFGSVWMVTIHPDHQQHEGIKNVAIKEIRVTRGNDKEGTDKAWDQEARALANINKLMHSNITECIAAIRKGDSRYFMFPWAEGGSLRDYWDQFPQQSPSAELIYQVIIQLRDVADALDCLHDCQLTAFEIEESSSSASNPPLGNPELLVQDEDEGIQKEAQINQKSIRHGDLKPENILRFKDRQTGLGILKIADMGLAKQHIVNTQERPQLTSTRYGTIKYEAPEAVTTIRGGRSRLYDIWSMGCITFEFIIWMLHGNQALNDFYSQVKGDAQSDCQYFELLDTEEFEQTGVRAKIHRVVLQWIDHFQSNDPEFSQDSAMFDLLKLVREKLLVVNLPLNRESGTEGGRMFAPPTPGEMTTRYRATAAQFRDALNDILDKIKISGTMRSSYCYTGKPRDQIPLPQPKTGGPMLSVPGMNPVGAALPRISEPPNGLVVPQSPLVTGLRVRSTRTANYALPPLKDWEFIIDNKFVQTLLAEIKQETFLSEPSAPAKLCDRCAKLNFWEGGFTLSDTLRALNGRAQRCEFCRLLRDCKPKDGNNDGLVQFDRNQSNLVLTGNPFPVLSIFRSPELQTPTPIQVGLPSLPDSRSDEFFQILRLWLTDCNENHDCRGPMIDRLPTRLIDVGTAEEEKLRLVETGEEAIVGQDYIALSHPWGDTTTYKPFCTLRKDLSEARHDLESFKESIAYSVLPKTFKDAVYCARKLGIRYLWIDSICIIQGTNGDFTQESKRMEDVFSGAYCVLAASRASNQQDGFLKSRQQRDYVTFQRGTEKPFYVCKMIDNFGKDVIEGPLNKRGWVLQERALARRTIYFTETQTYFECGSGVRCETMTRMHNNMADFLGDPRFPEKAMRTESRALKIEYFQDLYRLYSNLQFTKYEDRPFAVAGLEKRLREAFKTKGGYGIFDDGDRPDGGLFHRSLLWKRADDNVSLTLIDFPPEKDTGVPSWSWMAYKGGIDYTDPPYQSAEWERKEIQPPWTRSGIDRTDSAPREGEVALTAIVRDFAVAGREKNEVSLSYDTERTAGSDGQRAQCVIVAKSIAARSDRERVYYVLLVAPTQMTTGRGEKVYTRVGAGTMLGKFITLDGPGTAAKIY